MDLFEINTKNKNRHPWELSRSYSILKMLRRNPRTTQYADIGAGDMFFTQKLVGITDKPVLTVDINYNDIKNEGAIIKLREIDCIPENSVDFAILMDVLEHVQDDDSFIKMLSNIIKHKGQILITVPAHQFLFSQHDIDLKHFRRYSRKSLIRLMETNGFEVEELFYFYFILFFARCLKKLTGKLGFLGKKHNSIANWSLGPGNIITLLITTFLNLDFLFCKFLSKAGINLKGLSLCMICRKKYA